MSLFTQTLNFLESYFHGLASRSLGVTESEISSAIREFYAYSAFAAPLMPTLAISGCFHYNKTLSLLFLPFLVRHREIYLTDGNSRDLVTYLADTNLFDPETLRKVWKVNCNRWGSIYEEVDLTRVETFLSLLPGLRMLTLKSHTTDVILECVARHCPNLQVIDCREDSFCEVTDNGLEKLAQLKKIRYILFDTQADEYEEESEQMRFTAAGIVHLMTTLPELIKLDCPEYLMRDALHALKSSGKVLLSVKCIHLEGYEAHADTFMAANEVCPNITTLSVMVHANEEKDTATSLAAFTNLSSLTLNRIFTGVSCLKFHEYGHRLTVLDIKKQVFTMEDIFILNDTCPNLKLLAIFDYKQFNKSFTQVDCIGHTRPPLFPSLETLVYKLRDIQGLLLFMHKECLITSFFAKVGYLESTGKIIDVLEQLKPGSGYWPNLKVLSIPDVKCDRAILMQIIEGLPSLQRINIRLSDRFEKTSSVAAHGRNIKLSNFFEDDLFPPKHLAYEFDLS